MSPTNPPITHDTHWTRWDIGVCVYRIAALHLHWLLFEGISEVRPSWPSCFSGVYIHKPYQWDCRTELCSHLHSTSVNCCWLASSWKSRSINSCWSAALTLLFLTCQWWMLINADICSLDWCKLTYQQKVSRLPWNEVTAVVVFLDPRILWPLVKRSFSNGHENEIRDLIG